jgi:hypothetical protein
MTSSGPRWRNVIVTIATALAMFKPFLRAGGMAQGPEFKPRTTKKQKKKKTYFENVVAKIDS